MASEPNGSMHDERSPDLPLEQNPSGRSASFSSDNSATGSKAWSHFLSFLWKAILWGGCTFVLSNAFAAYYLWVVVLSVFLFSIPIFLGGIYGSTIRQIQGLTSFASHGWLYRVMSGRVLRVTIWVMWALISSFFMLVQFHTYSRVEWGAFFLVIPVFYAVFTACRHILARELRNYLVISRSLRWAAALTPIIMLAVYVAFMTMFGEVPSYDSLHQAISAQKAAVEDMTASAMVTEVSQWLALYNGVKVFALGSLAAQDALLALGIMAAGNLIIFFNACTMFGCFLIPAPEYLRVLGPLSDNPEPPPIRPARIAAISAIVTFLALFIYVPLFLVIDASMPRTGALIEKVEQVGSELFEEGTIAKIQDLKLEAARKYDVSLAKIEGEADRAFDRMESNVDAFLDWYYSLPAEYARVAMLLSGNLESYLQDKFAEYLLQGDAFKGVETALNDALSSHRSELEEYNQAVRKIINQNRVEVKDQKFHVVRVITMDEALNLPVHKDMIDFKKRIMGVGVAGTVAGSVTAVITGKIVSKIVGKATLKKAAQILAKVVASKVAGSAGGAAAGAAAGGAIGSVVPGVGTAIGAIIGGIAGGIAAGVTVDKLMLMLEEALNRADFKRELIDSIESARNEFKSKLKGT